MHNKPKLRFVAEPKFVITLLLHWGKCDVPTRASCAATVYIFQTVLYSASHLMSFGC